MSNNRKNKLVIILWILTFVAIIVTVVAIGVTSTSNQ
jgi:cytochrome c-type biogenesis protein CcmE